MHVFAKVKIIEIHNALSIFQVFMNNLTVLLIIYK